MADQHVGPKMTTLSHSDDRAYEREPHESPTRQFLRYDDAGIESVAEHDVAEYQHDHDRKQKDHETFDYAARAVGDSIHMSSVRLRKKLSQRNGKLSNY